MRALSKSHRFRHFNQKTLNHTAHILLQLNFITNSNYYSNTTALALLYYPAPHTLHCNACAAQLLKRFSTGKIDINGALETIK